MSEDRIEADGFTPELRQRERLVLVCACGHDERFHDRKIGPYLLCSMPGCHCADREYVSSKKIRVPE